MTSHQKKIIISILTSIAIFIILVLIWPKPSSRLITLEMWGVNDEPKVFQPLIATYQQMHPNIKITYTQKDALTYSEELLKAFADNKAPDIFIVPGNWIPTFLNKIEPLDLQKDKEYNLRLINDTYPQIVIDDLVDNQQLLGIPLSIDTLALYYNKDIFDYYNIPSPSSNWTDLINLIPQLRKINPQGQITRAALALGTNDNITWSTDILSAFMIQFGQPLADRQQFKIKFDETIEQTKITPGKEALIFYTQFSDPKSSTYTWANSFPNSLVAFSQGKTALMIGYRQAQEYLQDRTPDLRYGVVNLRIIPGGQNFYYGKTMNAVVSNRSSHPQEAWNFLKYLATKNVSQYYLNQTHNPPARLDLIDSALKDPKIGVFASQILKSRDWYQFDYQLIDTILGKMINDVTLGNIDPEQAVFNAAHSLELEWQKRVKNQ